MEEIWDFSLKLTKRTNYLIQSLCCSGDVDVAVPTLLWSLLALRTCSSCSRLGRSEHPSGFWFWLVLYFTWKSIHSKIVLFLFSPQIIQHKLHDTDHVTMYLSPDWPNQPQPVCVWRKHSPEDYNRVSVPLSLCQSSPCTSPAGGAQITTEVRSDPGIYRYSPV